MGAGEVVIPKPCPVNPTSISQPEPHSYTPVRASKVAESGRDKDDPLLTRLIYRTLAWINNVPAEKGRCHMDWLRFLRTQQPAGGGGGGEGGGGGPRVITAAEVRRHNRPTSAWMVFNSKVYDITHYLKYHPGGRAILLSVAGRDGTSQFMRYHPHVNIDALLGPYCLGHVAECSQ